ncbi:MAG: PEP-CTERM sorting domain-containing protein [Phycisphaerales bacterium]|nr:PEP-CTERM sorting domain-containing protein [Phycisphaerales bacterium]MCH2154259.1 PEP-CTERM sorting domain-containing protein [Phycisphaerales bacterium]
MNRLTLTAAGIASVAMAGAAIGETLTVSVDIAGNGYNASTFTSLGGGFSGASYAGALIVSWGFSNVSADVYFNEGSGYSNWASECRIGILDFSVGDTAGDVYWTYANPFTQNAGADTAGTYVNYTGGNFSSGDISSYGWNIGSEGDVELVATSSWNDGSGLDAGVFTSGTAWVTIDTIPAPGALALLGLAGVAGMGRRRR